MWGMRKIDEIVAANEFFPSVLGVFFNPFYFARKGLAEHVIALAGNISGRVIDIGCGTKPYEKLFHCDEYIGLEIDTPGNRMAKNADYFYDGKHFPFADEEFDCAVLNQVFEHVFNPDEFLSELKRILKPEGKILLTVPFVWDEHEQPYDFARYSSFGIVYILKKHGFTIIESRKSCNNIRCIFQLLGTFFYKKTRFNNWRLKFLSTTLFSTTINLAGILVNGVMPSNDDLYLDNIILAEMEPKGSIKS